MVIEVTGIGLLVMLYGVLRRKRFSQLTFMMLGIAIMFVAQLAANKVDQNPEEEVVALK